MTALVAVQGLGHRFPGGDPALDGVTFDVAEGERVALLGPNGAGKTTLVLALLGVVLPTAGTIEIMGQRLTAESAFDLRRHLGLVFQDPNDQLFMPTVRDDVAFGPANHGVTGRELERLVAEALDRVGAGHLAERAPHHLSGGERRRVAIAGVLAMRPRMLIMDEPSSGLDPAGRREFTELLSALPETLLLVTHDLEFARALCDRALVLDEGHLVGDGRVDNILEDESFLRDHRLS